MNGEVSFGAQKTKKMANISIISTTSVVPAASTNKPATARRIELTPWELQFLPMGPIQNGVLFLKPEPPQENGVNGLIDHLKTSLSHTLDLFYPLAGRLGATVNDDDKTTCFFLDCNAAGAQFIHAAAGSVTVAGILESVDVPRIMHSFFPLNNGVLNFEGVSQPLLGVQVTELVDGIFIGCTVNHSVADGTSFWHFFNTWSEISRGSGEIITLSPVFDRCFLNDVNNVHFPIPIPQSMLPFRPLTRSPNSLPPSLQERVFHFRKEKIEALKARANAEMGTNKISSLQALSAHLWRSLTRCRRLPEDQETKYMFLIDARPRMSPPLPAQYFGAATQSGTVTMKAGELLERGLGYAAWEMNRMIAAASSEPTNFLESWVKDPKPLQVPLSSTTSDSYGTSNSPRFNMYGTDFGWGKPVAVRSGGGPYKPYGKITLFPGAEEEGSIDIEFCLFPETFEAMMGDAEFLEAVTV